MMTESSQPSPRSDALAPRRPWLASLFTVLLPGLGHLYSGAPRRALLIWLLSLLLGVASVAVLTILSSFLVVLCGVLAAVLFLSVAGRDAALCARRAGTNYVLRRYNRWYVYTALLLVTAFLVQPRYVGLLHSLLQAYQIPNSSMEPTLLAGDYIVAKPLRRAPSRGQIVIYRRRQ